MSKIWILIILLLFFASTFLLMRSDVFVIRDLEIKANKVTCADQQQLKTASDIVGQNFFSVKGKIVEDKIKQKFLCVKNVSMEFLPFQKVKLTFFGRQTVVRLAKVAAEATTSSLLENIATPAAVDTKEFGVDDQGIIFSQNTFDNVPTIGVLQPDIYLGMNLGKWLITNILKILNQTRGMGIEAANTLLDGDLLIINPSSIQKEAPKIIFRVSDLVDVQLASLQLILSKAKIDESSLEFIDLRFDKPVVRFTPKDKNGQR